MNYDAVVFLLCPPDLLRREPLFDGTNVCNSQENGVRTRCAAVVNHYAIVNLLRRANSLRRSVFSTAGSFGISGLVDASDIFYFSARGKDGSSRRQEGAGARFSTLKIPGGGGLPLSGGGLRGWEAVCGEFGRGGG